MNDSGEPRYGEDLVRRYLLGQLDEEENDRLEEEMLRDDRQFDLVEAIEAELLEALAEGSLPPAERDLVRGRLAALPGGRQRLALGQEIAAEAARRAEQQKVRPFLPRAAAAGAPERQPPDRRRISRRLAAAAAVLLVAGLPLALRWIDPPVVASFELAMAAHRGDEAAEQLALPREADRVEIRVDLGDEPGDAFQATVRNAADGDEVWSDARLDVQALPAGSRRVTLEIDADDLPSGRYLLEVSRAGAAATADGEGFVGEQEFEIVRR